MRSKVKKTSVLHLFVKGNTASSSVKKQSSTCVPAVSECNSVPCSQSNSTFSVDDEHSDESAELRETEQDFQTS